MRVRTVSLALVGLLSRGAGAGAQTEPGRLELLLGTEFPQWLGGGLSVGVGRRARIQSVVGGSVAPYVDVVHLGVSAALGNPSREAALRKAVDSFVVWRTHALWRPSPSLGFEFGGGFGLMVVRGDVSGEVALAIAETGATMGLLPPPYELRALLFQADLEAAWRVPLGSGFSLRFALGAAVTFYADTAIVPRYRVSAESAETQAVLDRGEAALGDWFSSWRLIPGASITLHLTL